MGVPSFSPFSTFGVELADWETSLACLEMVEVAHVTREIDLSICRVTRFVQRLTGNGIVGTAEE